MHNIAVCSWCQTSTEAEKESLPGVTHTVGQQQDLEPEKLESSQDNSDENLTTVPTSKSGTRRKHHRAWTLGEVMKLVDGVSRYGAGRWSEIKRLAFASYTYRTSVDLKVQNINSRIFRLGMIFLTRGILSLFMHLQSLDPVTSHPLHLRLSMSGFHG